MRHQFPAWMRTVLLLAAAVHVVAGLGLLARPELLAYMGWGGEGDSFAIRLLGGVDAAVGAGYLVAAMAPLRYWPAVLVGLLENAFTAVAAALSGVWIAAAVSIAWLIPLSLILGRTSRDYIEERGAPAADPRHRAMLKAMTQDGYSLYELSQLRPTLVVFLRHAGCMFCREAVTELARLRPEIERTGSGLAFVTMSPEPEAHTFFTRYRVADVPRVSDPECRLYRAFDLKRAEWRDLFGLQEWKRGFEASVIEGHGMGALETDPFRMPGVFLVHNGKVIRGFRHDSPADRPDYLELADCRECLEAVAAE